MAERTNSGVVTLHVTASKYFEDASAVVADGAINEMTWAEQDISALLSENGWQVRDTRTVAADPVVIEDLGAEAVAAEVIAEEEIAEMLDE